MDLVSNPWFIGIGASVIAGLLLYFVFGIGKTKHKPEHAKSDIVTHSDTESSSVMPVVKPDSIPTPKEISEYLHGLPPLQIDQAARNYQGISVRWEVELSSSFNANGKQYIILNSQEHGGLSIVCPIDIEKYPQLKILKKGHPFIVEGIIVSVDIGKINLDSCHLYFSE
jgi:hypothetical protein